MNHIQNEQVAVNPALESSDPELIVLSQTGRPRLITSRAWEWLEEYFGSTCRRKGRLPNALQKRIRSRKVLLGIKDGHTPRRKTFITEKGSKRLEVRFIPEPNPTFLILEEKLISPPLVLLERLGLSKREGEVLAWVAQGKTNNDIGMILSIKPRTVGKHLEHIYQKLGVETRTSAATFALEPNQ